MISGWPWAPSIPVYVAQTALAGSFAFTTAKKKVEVEQCYQSHCGNPIKQSISRSERISGLNSGN